MEKRHLYTQLKCPNEKFLNGKNSILAGRVYDLGGLTAKFNQPANRPTVIQDGTKYLALGTIHNKTGKSRHKLLMAQDPIEDNTNSGKGNAIKALRISGFQVKHEEPEIDTTELTHGVRS